MNKEIQGLGHYSYDEIIEIINDFINDRLEDEGYLSDDIVLKDLKLHGSRLRGQARDDSDLDVVVEYEGDIREDDFFNMLNDDPLYIDDIVIDINPIKEDMGDYMKRSDNYDKRKLGLESKNLCKRFKSKKNEAKFDISADIFQWFNKRCIDILNNGDTNPYKDELEDLTYELKYADVKEWADELMLDFEANLGYDADGLEENRDQIEYDLEKLINDTLDRIKHGDIEGLEFARTKSDWVDRYANPDEYTASLESRISKLEDILNKSSKIKNEASPIVAKVLPLIVKNLPILLDLIPQLMTALETDQINDNTEFIHKLQDFTELGEDIVETLNRFGK